MKTRFSKVLACLFAGILTATAADYSVFAAQTSTLEYYVCPNSKILKEDETDYSEMVRNGKLMFAAAANERESGQIILTGSGTHQISLGLKGDFKGANNYSIPGGNFEIYFEDYVFEVPDTNITDAGVYPDALIPIDIATHSSFNADIVQFGKETSYTYEYDKKTVNHKSVKKNQGIWFTLTIPKGTPAGTYTSTVVCWSSKTGTINIPVEVNVFDFELPDKTESVEWLEVHAHSNCINSIQSVTGIIDKDNANILYLDEMNNFLDKRKVSSGHSGVVYNDLKPDKLDEYVKGVSDFVKNNRAPYYDITVDYSYTKPPIDVTANADFMNALVDYVKTKNADQAVEDLYNALKNGVINYFNKEELYIIQNALVNEENGLKGSLKKFIDMYSEKEIINYKGTIDYNQWISSNLSECLRGNQGDSTAPMYCYLYSSLTVISEDNFYNPWGNERCGVSTILKKIVDRSIEDNYDLLQYAFLKIPYVDEPCAWLISDNLQTLLNARVFDQCKDVIKDYIKNSACNGNNALKESLMKSCQNLMMIFTTTPTSKNVGYVAAHDKDERIYTAIQYNGLNNYTLKKEDIVLLKDKYNNITHEFETEYKNNGTVIVLDNGYSNKYFCPLFTDFSENALSKAQDFSTTWGALGNTPMWWYSCGTSNRSAGIAGFRLNQNRGKIDDSGSEIYMNPLAVKRANKWQQYDMGIIGEHFWAVDANYKYPETLGKMGNEDLLVYPIKKYMENKGITSSEPLDRYYYFAKGHFFSTIRLENEAEANDDYDYLCLAKQLANAYPKHPEYQKRLNSIIKMLIEPWNVDYTNPSLTNSTNLTQARNLLAAFIEGRFGNLKEVTPTANNAFTSKNDGVPVIKNWHKCNKVLCFDVLKTATYSKGNTATVGLMTPEGRALSEPLTIDFKNSKISGCTGAMIISQGNGWYTVQIPMNKTTINKSAGRNVYETETFGYLYFHGGNVQQSFLVDNIRLK